jgi:hypothetical protein
MSKAKQKVTTIGDRRILDAVKAAKTALAEYRVISREVSRLYHEAECHPDMPEHGGSPAASPAEFAARERARKKIWHQTGYDVASDHRNKARDVLRPMLRRICRLQPRTVEALSAKSALLKTALDVDYWDGEDFIEYALPVLIADLARLTGKAVRS